MTLEKNFYDYVWQVREYSVKSCVGYLTLAIGMINYITSCFFIRMYVRYGEAVKNNNLDSLQCEIASAWVLLSYCSLF